MLSKKVCKKCKHSGCAIWGTEWENLVCGVEHPEAQSRPVYLREWDSPPSTCPFVLEHLMATQVLWE